MPRDFNHASARPAVIASILQQHAEEASRLAAARANLIAAADIKLPQLLAHDDRLLAHCDGLSVAGDDGWSVCDSGLEEPSVGALFLAAVRSIEAGHQDRLDRLFALVEAVPTTRDGLTSALEWLDRRWLVGVVVGLLSADDPVKRTVGIAASAMHGVDPGLVSGQRISDVSSLVRARALRAAGEIGCQDAGPQCAAAIRESDVECAFWGAWSSLLLGDAAAGLPVIKDAGVVSGPHRRRAFRLTLQAMSVRASHGFLQQFGGDPERLRWLVEGSGIAGDPKYVPWLIDHMANAETARLAGEAFSLITGVDLAERGSAGDIPANFESGPNDDPDDPNVEMDPDEGLPWPDVPKSRELVGRQRAAGSREGMRYFMGAPVTREHCIEVLKNGYQRQRILAAHYLCLLEPGTPLFNTSAPAWRQQRLLAKMT